MNKKPFIIVIGLVLLLGGLLLLACPRFFAGFRPSGELTGSPAPAAEAVPPRDAVRLRHLWVHGESALLGLADGEGAGSAAPQASSLTLRGAGGRVNYVFLAADSQYVNRGLILWQLPPAEYEVYYNGRPVAAGELWLPQGYTLPRQGQRLHWRFAANAEGLLTLSVESLPAEDLPQGWYDVIVDAGHGGLDTGAYNRGYAEAALNLDNAYGLQAQLQALGLRVALTREDGEVPGGAAAENNPYARDARVERVYRSHAPYLLSCHLNAGEGQQQGFQIYASVESDARWAQQVAQAWREAGATENNHGSGLTDRGVYQRPTAWTDLPRDYYFILRETGGYALSPAYFIVSHRDMRQELAQGAEALLLEFAFMDNDADLRYWLENRELLLEATAQGCAEYWKL